MPNEFLTNGDLLLWTILCLGVVAVVVFLERSLHLHRSRINVRYLLDGISNNLRHGNVTEAILLCDEAPGPAARIVSDAIRDRSLSRADLANVLQAVGTAEISRMERRLSVLVLIAQTAPLLGLLGTVQALLRTVLLAQEKAPLIQMTDLLHGLVPAFTTTIAGLLVAVPAYVGFNVLVVKIDRIVLDMEHAATYMVRLLDNLRNTSDNRQRTLGL